MTCVIRMAVWYQQRLQDNMALLLSSYQGKTKSGITEMDTENIA